MDSESNLRLGLLRPIFVLVNYMVPVFQCEQRMDIVEGMYRSLLQCRCISTQHECHRYKLHHPPRKIVPVGAIQFNGCV